VKKVGPISVYLVSPEVYIFFVPLERSKLIVAVIEGLESIHKVLSSKNLMLLTNQIKEICLWNDQNLSLQYA
jgi:hypothetical protein